MRLGWRGPVAAAGGGGVPVPFPSSARAACVWAGAVRVLGSGNWCWRFIGEEARQLGQAWRLVAEVTPWPHLPHVRLALGFQDCRFQSSGHQVLNASEVKGIWLILFYHLRPVNLVGVG